MTHTIADAEAAVARHPESLETLSMAADLLIEAGDPRGEDFAACLDGRLSAEKLMRRHPACRYAMFVAAWAMEPSGCRWCGGTGMIWPPGRGPGGAHPTWEKCGACGGSPSRAEALRLLAECGKVGREEFGYDDPHGWEHEPEFGECVVALGWWRSVASRLPSADWANPVTERLALLDAYATAGPDTRRRWAAETRAPAAAPVEATP